jgi:uncharacterized protein with HEPN domain
MRRSEALLMDMLLASRKIHRFTDGLDKSEFENNELIQSAVLREFQVLGEAARMISDEAKAEYPNIPWSLISGMRNRLIHEYFKIDVEIIWSTVQKSIPELILLLEKAIPPENDEESQAQ